MKRLVFALLLGGFFIAPAQAYEARMYGMRGLFGGVAGYSWGVDTALNKVAKAHPVKTYVKPWYRWEALADTAIANHKIDGLPVFVLGHSFGANKISAFAAKLRRAGVPVVAAFYYDPTPLVKCVPANVTLAISWRRTAAFNLGGGIITSCTNDPKASENYNVNTTHTSLDDQPIVHAGTVKHVGEVLHMLKEMKRK